MSLFVFYDCCTVGTVNLFAVFRHKTANLLLIKTNTESLESEINSHHHQAPQRNPHPQKPLTNTDHQRTSINQSINQWSSVICQGEGWVIFINSNSFMLIFFLYFLLLVSSRTGFIFYQLLKQVTTIKVVGYRSPPVGS